MLKALLMDRKHRIFLLIFVFGIFIRLWSVNNPLLDQHGWRQSSCGIVVRNYLSDMNLFHPRVDMLTPGYPSAFSFYEYYVAILAKVLGYSIQLGRLTTLAVFLVGFIYFYKLVLRFMNHNTALWASFFYAVLPTSAYYSRSFQCDSGMVSFTIIFIYYFTKWIDDNHVSDYLLSIVTCFLMLSFKITALYMMIPVAAYAFMHKGWKILFDWKYYAFIFASLCLPIVYHLYVPVASHGFYNSAFFAQDKWGNLPIWLSLDFWWKTFLPFGNLWEYQLAHAGYILFVMGILIKPDNRKQWVFYFWMGSVFTFFIVAAYGMHHEYYSLPLIPVACVFIGRFLASFYSKYSWNSKNHRLKIGLVSFLIFYSFVFSLIRLYDRCNINSNVHYLKMAEVIQANSERNDLVIYATRGYEELQYCSNRKGVHLNRLAFKELDNSISAENSNKDVVRTFIDQNQDSVKPLSKDKFRIIAIADYNLAKECPSVYRYLKSNFNEIYETDSNYIFKL